MEPITAAMLLASLASGTANYLSAGSQKYDQTADDLARQEAARLRAESNVDTATGRVANVKSAIMTNALRNFMSAYGQGTDPNQTQNLLQQAYAPAFPQLASFTDAAYNQQLQRKEGLREKASELETGAAERKSQFEANKSAAKSHALTTGLADLASTGLGAYGMQKQSEATSALTKALEQQPITYGKSLDEMIDAMTTAWEKKQKKQSNVAEPTVNPTLDTNDTNDYPAFFEQYGRMN